MDTIKELFYGNIHPFERDIPKYSEGDKLNQLIIRHTATLKAMLNEQEMQIVERLKDALAEQSSLCECEGFINGFRLGVKLMANHFVAKNNNRPTACCALSGDSILYCMKQKKGGYSLHRKRC